MAVSLADHYGGITGGEGGGHAGEDELAASSYQMHMQNTRYLANLSNKLIVASNMSMNSWEKVPGKNYGTTGLGEPMFRFTGEKTRTKFVDFTEGYIDFTVQIKNDDDSAVDESNPALNDDTVFGCYIGRRNRVAVANNGETGDDKIYYYDMYHTKSEYNTKRVVNANTGVATLSNHTNLEIERGQQLVNYQTVVSDRARTELLAQFFLKEVNVYLNSETLYQTNNLRRGRECWLFHLFSTKSYTHRCGFGEVIEQVQRYVVVKFCFLLNLW